MYAVLRDSNSVQVSQRLQAGLDDIDLALFLVFCIFPARGYVPMLFKKADDAQSTALGELAAGINAQFRISRGLIKGVGHRGKGFAPVKAAVSLSWLTI